MANVVGMIDPNSVKDRVRQAKAQKALDKHAQACKNAIREANDHSPLRSSPFAGAFRGITNSGKIILSKDRF